MMPPDDTAIPAIVPELREASTEKLSTGLEDVRHWFNLETIVEIAGAGRRL